MGARAAFNLGPTSIDIGSVRSTFVIPDGPQCGRSGIQRVSRSLRWLDSRSDLRSAGNDSEAKTDEAVSYAIYLITCQNIPATHTKPSVKSTVLR